jgi:hypothetical protein
MTSRLFVTGVAGGHPARKAAYVSSRVRITGSDGIERLRAVENYLTGNAAQQNRACPVIAGSYRVPPSAPFCADRWFAMAAFYRGFVNRISGRTLGRNR